MKNLKLILLLQALVFGALTLNADDDCCADGNPPAFDCEDGGDLVCEATDCPPCSTHNPNPSEDGMKCCNGEEVAAMYPEDSCDPEAPTDDEFSQGAHSFSSGSKTVAVLAGHQYVRDRYSWTSGTHHDVYIQKLFSEHESEFASSNCGDNISEQTENEGSWSVSASITIQGFVGLGVSYSGGGTNATLFTDATAESGVYKIGQIYKEEREAT